MKIERQQHDGKTVIAPEGDIDMYSSPDLRKELMLHIQQKTPYVFVNFANVSYIDSSGIATFVEGLKAMKSYGGRLKLFQLPDEIMEIFRFARLDTIFEIHGDMNDAFNS